MAGRQRETQRSTDPRIGPTSPAEKRQRDARWLENLGGTRALSKTLKRIRAERRWSQRDVAQAVGWTSGVISNIERADRNDLTLYTVARLAFACQVRVAVFVRSFALPQETESSLEIERFEWIRQPWAPRSAAFGSALRRIREKELRLTRRTFAEQAMLHPKYLAAIETGEIDSPRLSTLVRLGLPMGRDSETCIQGMVRLARVFADEPAGGGDSAATTAGIGRGERAYETGPLERTA